MNTTNYFPDDPGVSAVVTPGKDHIL